MRNSVNKSQNGLQGWFVLGVMLASGLLVGGAAGAAAPQPYRIYVTNERSGTLSVIDGATRQVVETVPLGKRPRGLKLSHDGKQLLVALSGSPIAGPGVDESKLPPPDKTADGIGVIDLATLKLVRVIRGVSDPEQLAVSHEGRKLFIASEDTGAAIVLDAQDGHRIASIKVGGEPEGVSLSPDGRLAYVTSESDHRVSVIDVTTTKLLHQIEVGQRPRFTAFSPDGAQAYVSNENEGSLSVIDTKAFAVIATIKLDGPLTRPVGAVTSLDGRRLYVAAGRSGLLLAIDLATRKVAGQVAVGPRPWSVDRSPDGTLLYTANGSSNDVSVVDAATLKVLAKVPVGEGPWAAVVGPAPRR
jgi:YVTN family beta-propeller protein